MPVLPALWNQPGTGTCTDASIQWHLESDGLVGADEDAHAQVVAAHDLGETGVLGVGEADPAQLHRHLQTERAQLPARQRHRVKISKFATKEKKCLKF